MNKKKKYTPSPPKSQSLKGSKMSIQEGEAGYREMAEHVSKSLDTVEVHLLGYSSVIVRILMLVWCSGSSFVSLETFQATCVFFGW